MSGSRPLGVVASQTDTTPRTARSTAAARLPTASGHGNSAPGNAATKCPSAPIHAAGTPAAQTSGCAQGPGTAQSTSAAVPSTVTGGTSGAETTFAGMEYGLKAGVMPSSTGRQNSCALALMATPSASQPGMIRRPRRPKRCPASTMPAVARAESWNAGSLAYQGSQASTATTHTHSDVGLA